MAPRPAPPTPDGLVGHPVVDPGGRPRAPTERRIEVARAQRKIMVATREARSRRHTAALLLVVDTLAWAGYLLGLPLMAWEAPWEPAVPWLLIGGAIAGAALAGAYRVGGATPGPRLGALGAAVGLGGAWLTLKFLSTKGGAAALTPPAAEGTLLAALAFAAWVLASRGLVARLRRRREARAKLLFIGPAHKVADLRARLRERRHRAPIVHFDPTLDAPPPDPTEPAWDRPHEVHGGSAGPAGGADAACSEPAPGLPLSALDEHMAGALKAVVLATPAETLPASTLADLVHCRLLNVPVLTPGQLVEELWQRTPADPDDPAWYLHDERLHGGRAILTTSSKRAVDVLGALVGLALGAPALLLAALLVRLTSRGPALYRQTRIGRWKVPFTLYKLRTMRADAEPDGARWAAPDDPRVTRVGRWLRRTRLDELPQLWNVLVGHMSLVGPRPERPEHTAQLEERLPYYDLRHLMKPGITGWAQVNFGYGASVEDAVTKLEYDIYYVKHASLALDLRILARTVGVVLSTRGV